MHTFYTKRNQSEMYSHFLNITLPLILLWVNQHQRLLKSMPLSPDCCYFLIHGPVKSTILSLFHPFTTCVLSSTTKFCIRTSHQIIRTKKAIQLQIIHYLFCKTNIKSIYSSSAFPTWFVAHSEPYKVCTYLHKTLIVDTSKLVECDVLAEIKLLQSSITSETAVIFSANFISMSYVPTLVQ